eukprot:83701_1
MFPVKKYLNSSAIKFKTTIRKIIVSEHNTLFEFINWILSEVQTHQGINAHFNLFVDGARKFIKSDWNIFHIKNSNVWLLMLKSILTQDQFKSKYITDIRLNNWSIFCQNEIMENNVTSIRGYTATSTNADLKTLHYYYNISVLHKALIRTKYDYVEFGFMLPSWICQLFFDSNHNLLRGLAIENILQFINSSFSKYQIPKCMDFVYMNIYS